MTIEGATKIYPKFAAMGKAAKKPKAAAAKPKAAAPAPKLPALPDLVGPHGGIAPVAAGKTLEVVKDANGKHLQRVETAMQLILGHPLFANIMHETPPKIDKDAETSKAGMQAG